MLSRHISLHHTPKGQKDTRLLRLKGPVSVLNEEATKEEIKLVASNTKLKDEKCM